MNFCFHITRRLAAYCEGELSTDERVRVAKHLEKCEDCRMRSGQIRKNMRLMRQLPFQEPADELWSSITKELAGSRRRKPSPGVFPARKRLGFGLRWALRPAMAVVALFIITFALWLGSTYRLVPGSRNGELSLAGYLDMVSTVVSAESDLKEFPPAPDFTNVDWTQARSAANFPVIAPESLPGEYRLTAVRLYTRGDLRALQFTYSGEQGGVCVFQLPSGAKLSFGERNSEPYKTDSVHCRRTRSRNCSFYHFELGNTQLVMMTRRTEPAAVDELIRAFKAEFEKSNLSPKN